MPKNDDWFKHIAVVNRSRLLQDIKKKRDQGAPLPRVRGARLIDMDAWKYPRVGTKIWYIDRFETVYTTRDLIRIFDIDKTTVYKWIKVGLLPQPLFVKINKYNTETRYYVRAQLIVVAKVVNDLRRQGVIRFTKKKIRYHLEMIEKGNAQALARWHRRRERELERKSKGPNGVIWLQD